MRFALQVALAWICLWGLPLPRVSFAEGLWARFDAWTISSFINARYEHSPSSDFPHRVRIQFPSDFVNNPSPAYIMYGPPCVYFNIILASIVLAFRGWSYKNILIAIAVGFTIANACNALRIASGGLLRLQDYPMWFTHDIPNYLFGSLALVLSYWSIYARSTRKV